MIASHVGPSNPAACATVVEKAHKTGVYICLWFDLILKPLKLLVPFLIGHSFTIFLKFPTTSSILMLILPSVLLKHFICITILSQFF